MKMIPDTPPPTDPTIDEEPPATVEGIERILPPMPRGMTLPQLTDAYPVVMPFGDDEEKPKLPRPTDDQIDQILGAETAPPPDGGMG